MSRLNRSAQINPQVLWHPFLWTSLYACFLRSNKGEEMQKLWRCLAFVLMIGVLGGAFAPSLAGATDGPIIVVVRFFPAEGREDETQARLANLARFVQKANPGVIFQLHRSAKSPTVFLLYETFPTQAALDNQPKTVLPDFVKEFGPTPQGLLTRPNEVEFYRKLSD